jgi:beta-glucosidase
LRRYLSGEDPFLGRLMVAPVVKGIQAEGVIANVKHFVNNNQEHNRGEVSAVVDERTEWEIYFHPFHAAVEAGALSIMCSYNKINGTYSCENAVTLSLSLKQRMNFSGFVVSDWGGTHSTVAAANAGLDVEMPVGVHFSDVLLKTAVDNGSVSSSVIDDKVTRILTAMYAIGLFDHPSNGSLSNNVTSDKNNNLARRIAAAAAVLLKNDNGSDGRPLLPINPTSSTRIAVIGSCASSNPLVHGQGSGEVISPYIITLLQGVTAAAPAASVTYHETLDVIHALEAARAATHVIVAACTVSGEGTGRLLLSTPSHSTTPHHLMFSHRQATTAPSPAKTTLAPTASAWRCRPRRTRSSTPSLP